MSNTITRINLGGGTVIVDYKHLTVRIEEKVDVRKLETDEVYDILKMEIISGGIRTPDGFRLDKGTVPYLKSMPGWTLIGVEDLIGCYIAGDLLNIAILGQGTDDRAIYMQHERIYPDETGRVLIIPGSVPYIKAQHSDEITFHGVSERDIITFVIGKRESNSNIYYIPINP